MKKFITTIFLLFCLLTIQGQNRITGTIMKDNGKPSKGSKIQIKGSKTNTKTQAEGKFLLENVSTTDSLVIKVSKNEDLIFAIGNQTNFDITLNKKEAIIDSGTEKRNITYRKALPKSRSSDFITAEQIEQSGSRNFIDIIRRVPGINISENEIVIRGKNSFASSSTPLFILDGSETSQSAVESLNVDMIESIQINKTGAGYGSRGANGVIIVKTKK